jgi:hypothetical protein
MKSRYMVQMIGLLALLAFASSLGQANTLNPGDTKVPDPLVVGGTATLVGTVSGTLVGSFTAPYTENVYSDPLNTFCAGCLDFVIAISNAGPATDDSIRRVALASFAGFSVDAGDNTKGAPGLGVPGAIAPVSVDRSSVAGGVVGFNYADGAFLPGDGSVLLQIDTNATTFSPGTIGAIDAVTANGAGLAPAPEPAYTGLMLFGLFGAGLFAARRFRTSQS